MLHYNPKEGVGSSQYQIPERRTFNILSERNQAPNDNDIKCKKFNQSGAMPPADYKCLICDKVVTPGTLKTFNMHLKSSHFNQELLSAFLMKQPPYACNNNSCADSSLTIGAKVKEFKSPMDLLDHMIDSHNLVLDMYYEHIRVKQTQRAVHGSTSQTCDTDEFPSQNGVEHTTVKKPQSPLIHESVFVCIVCKNKNNDNHMQDFINAYTTCKGLGNERSPPEVALPYGIFVKEKMLRNHLIDAHFKDLIVKYMDRQMNIYLNNYPIICPVYQCRRQQLVMKEEKLFISHFVNEHQRQFNLPQNKYLADMLPFVEAACQKICLDCNFVAVGNSNVAIHSCKEHPSRLFGFLKKMALDKTLLPVKITSLYKPNCNYNTHISNTTKSTTIPLNAKSSPKYEGKILQYPNPESSENKRKRECSNIIGSNDCNMPKVKKMDENPSSFYNCDTIDNDSQRSQNPYASAINNIPKVSIKKSPVKQEQAIRAPTKSEMDMFLKICFTNPQCRCCGTQIWIAADSRGLRLSRLCKHLYKEHFFEEIRLSVMDLISNVEENKKCPHCQEQLRSVELMEHMAVFHRRVLIPYWEYATFKMTRLSSNEPLNAENKLKFSTKLTKFGEESDFSLEVERIVLQKKLSELPNGEVITQPDACFNVSCNLNDCHECWKIRNGISPRSKGTVCQFAGFRKIRKVQTNFQGVSDFEEAGFLDPYKDPTNVDRCLWTATEEHLHQDMTEEIAEFVLRKAGDQFCNMIYDENCVIKEFVQDRRKNGKNPAVIWKRLQPQVNIILIWYPKEAFKNRYYLDFQNSHMYNYFYRSESCVMSVRHPCSIYTGLVRHVGVLFVSIATGREKKVINYYIQVLKETVLKQ